jgi:hypothetical protein
MEKSKFKVGEKVWIVESELGGTEFIKCKVVISHLGTKDDEDDEPYPDDEYDVKSEDGRIWDFVDVSDIYKTKKEAKEDY